MAVSSPFVEASQPTVLRSAQKDESYIANLRKELADIIQRLFGNQTPLQVQTVSDIASVLLYYSLTTLLDNQTLGEEYVGLLQVDSSLRRLPSKTARLSAILLQVMGPRIVSRFMNRLSVWLRSPNNCSQLKVETREKLLILTDVIKNSVFWVGRLNLALFYILGKYYRISQRVASIRFILTSKHLQVGASPKTFRIIGITALIHLLLVLFIHVQNHVLKSSSTLESSRELQRVDESKNSSADPSTKCSLCWEQRTNTACTPCGHLFCWACVLHWLQTKHECPLCRETVQPSRVVPLLNYK